MMILLRVLEWAEPVIRFVERLFGVKHRVFSDDYDPT